MKLKLSRVQKFRWQISCHPRWLKGSQTELTSPSAPLCSFSISFWRRKLHFFSYLKNDFNTMSTILSILFAFIVPHHSLSMKASDFFKCLRNSEHQHISMLWHMKEKNPNLAYEARSRFPLHLRNWAWGFHFGFGNRITSGIQLPPLLPTRMMKRKELKNTSPF